MRCSVIICYAKWTRKTDQTTMLWIILFIGLSTGAPQDRSILTPPIDVTGNLGRTAKFMCEVEFKGIPVFEWRFNNSIIYSRQHSEEQYPKGDVKYSVAQVNRTFILSVNDLQVDDKGKYTCRVLDETKEATLNVIGASEQDTILTPPGDVTGKLGETVEFICEVKFKGISVLAWEFNGDTIYSLEFEHVGYPKGRDKYSVAHDGRTFILSIRDLEYKDGGTYTCKVPSQTKAGNLIVAGPQRLSTPPNPVEGSTAQYTCTVEFTGPKMEDISPLYFPQVQMFFDGQYLNGTIIEQKHKGEGDSMYYKLTQIQNITLEVSMHGKQILCEITTSGPGIPEIETTEVVVQYSVRNVSYIPIRDIYEVGSVIICSADGNPPPQFQWEDIKDAGNIIHGMQLTITRKMAGSNTFRCTAMNTINGQTQHESVEAVFEAGMFIGEDIVMGNVVRPIAWPIEHCYTTVNGYLY